MTYLYPYWMGASRRGKTRVWCSSPAVTRIAGISDRMGLTEAQERSRCLLQPDLYTCEGKRAFNAKGLGAGNWRMGVSQRGVDVAGAHRGNSNLNPAALGTHIQCVRVPVIPCNSAKASDFHGGNTRFRSRRRRCHLKIRTSAQKHPFSRGQEHSCPNPGTV